MLSIRQFSLILCVFCSVITGIAYYLQFSQNALPCSLCVVQRLVFIALAISFLLCALQKPQRKGIWLYTLLNLLAVTIGLLASARQIWLQNRPIGQSICMPMFPSALNHSSMLNILNSLGRHDCTEAGPYFLGLSLSLWTFLLFSVLGALILILPLLFANPAPVQDVIE